MIDLNKVTIGVLCGIAGGVVAGIGARIAMRGVALAANIPPSFSIGGTLAILVVGVILGIPIGLLFVAIRRWLPGGSWRGLIFGLLLALVFVAPPFLLIEPQGELALLPPLTGLSLFAPLPMIYGLVIEAAVNRMDKKDRASSRSRVGVVWFALFGLTFVLGLVGFSSFFTSPAFPSALARALRDAGVPSRAFQGVNTGIMIAFAIAYFGACALIFWRGSGSWMPAFAALTLLAFAAAFFNSRGFLAVTMIGLPVAHLVPALAQAVALGSIVLFLFLFPDGQFVPGWTRPAAVVLFGWALFWFLKPWPGSPLDPESWPELLRLIMLVGIFGVGAFAQVYRYRRASTPEQRRQTKWVVAGVSGAVLVFALVGLSQVLIQGPGPVRAGGISDLFAFSIYLLPWLLIPLSIGISMRRYGLWDTTERDHG